jgi:hypothetical protein
VFSGQELEELPVITDVLESLAFFGQPLAQFLEIAAVGFDRGFGEAAFGDQVEFEGAEGIRGNSQAIPRVGARDWVDLEFAQYIVAPARFEFGMEVAAFAVVPASCAAHPGTGSPTRAQVEAASDFADPVSDGGWHRVGRRMRSTSKIDDEDRPPGSTTRIDDEDRTDRTEYGEEPQARHDQGESQTGSGTQTGGEDGGSGQGRDEGDSAPREVVRALGASDESAGQGAGQETRLREIFRAEAEGDGRGASATGSRRAAPETSRPCSGRTAFAEAGRSVRSGEDASRRRDRSCEREGRGRGEARGGESRGGARRREVGLGETRRADVGADRETDPAHG